MRGILLLGWLTVIGSGTGWGFPSLPALTVDGLPPQPVRAAVAGSRWEGSETLVLDLGSYRISIRGISPEDVERTRITSLDAETYVQPDGLSRLVSFLDETEKVIGVIGINQRLGARLMDTFTIFPGRRIGPAPEPRRTSREVILKKGDIETRIAPGSVQIVEIGSRKWRVTCYRATSSAAECAPVPAPSSQGTESSSLPPNDLIADESPAFSIDYTLFPVR